MGGVALPMASGWTSALAASPMPDDGLERATPESQGISSASIIGFLDDIEQSGFEARRADWSPAGPREARPDGRNPPIRMTQTPV
jgi:hypothetical protein